MVWHSGKLRARQTAEAFWRACNPLAECSAARDLLIAGHFPHLPRLLTLLVTNRDEPLISFPLHGVVAIEREDADETWTEMWRIGEGSDWG